MDGKKPSVPHEQQSLWEYFPKVSPLLSLMDGRKERAAAMIHLKGETTTAFLSSSPTPSP